MNCADLERQDTVTAGGPIVLSDSSILSEATESFRCFYDKLLFFYKKNNKLS